MVTVYEEATGTPFQEPVVDGHSSHETPVQEQPRVEVPSAHETTVPEASPHVERPGWQTWPDRTELPDWTEGPGGSGGGDGGDELTDSEGDVGWVHPLGVCRPNSVLGVLCWTNFPGFVMLPGEDQVPTLGFSWEHYQAAQAPPEEIIDGVYCHMRAEMVIKSFWVPPRWCADKMDCWEALVDEWCTGSWRAVHENAKNRRSQMAALQKERLANQAALEKERLASEAALEAALEKERLASQTALDERDQTTARLIEEERSRNEAGSVREERSSPSADARLLFDWHE
ncbi:hypothetical protein ZWY2020_002348 [Hordeum vulgare]|nr:hypothetical protein ZWY2020_002348 [Hordeum vulgare]